MGRKPNYQFERQERERLKAAKLAEKARAKQAEKERAEAQDPNRSPASDAGEG
jgi:hypothetical protein